MMLTEIFLLYFLLFFDEGHLLLSYLISHFGLAQFQYFKLINIKIKVKSI